MRQRVDPDLPMLKQTTPDVHRETTLAPASFNLNRNNALCLPLVSDSRRIIWVHSNQIDLQMDGAAVLDKAFDRFPYLTEKQTVVLAQRCSLHPDQVKVWFMLQRLRYGISWDYKDIQQVRRKIRPKKEKENLQNGMKEEVNEDGGEKRQKTEVDKFAGKKVGKVTGQQSRNKGRMMAKNVRANEQQRKTKQDKTVKNRKVDKVEEAKRNIQQKWKNVTVTDKTRKKRMKKVDDGAVEIKAEANKRSMFIPQWPADKRFVVPDELLDVSPLLFPQPPPQAFNVPQVSDNLTEMMERGDVFPTTSNCHGSFEVKSEMESSLQEEIGVDLIDHSVTIRDADKLKEIIEANNPNAADGSSVVTQQQDSHVLDPCTPHPQLRSTAKTQAQLEMLKIAFSYCQYPDREDYDRLSMVIGIHRSVLVQWFADMRYYIKKARPRWMTEEQHSQVLANITNRQFLKMLAKAQTVKGI